MSSGPQHIALIGGTGFVGTHLIEWLVRRQRQVRVLTRRRERCKALATLPGVSLHEGGAESLDALLAGQDAAVYLVGILHGSRQDFERAHIGLLQDVIAACQRQGVRHIALAGGVCLNLTLLDALCAQLAAAGLTPLLAIELPPNDGGVSLGQAWVARHLGQ